MIAERLRSLGFWAEVAYGTASLKNQMKRADRLGARFVFILGQDEIKEGLLSYKRMDDGSSGKISAGEAEDLLASK